MPESKQVWIERGIGYWDLTKYPWGGSFKRTTRQKPTTGTLTEIIDTFSDGSPKHIEVCIPGCERAGFTVGLKHVKVIEN